MMNSLMSEVINFNVGYIGKMKKLNNSYRIYQHVMSGLKTSKTTEIYIYSCDAFAQ